MRNCVGFELEQQKKLFHAEHLPKIIREILLKAASMELLVHHGLATEEAVTGHARESHSSAHTNPHPESSEDEVQEEAGDAGDTESEHSVSPAPPELPDETCTALDGITDPEDVAFLHDALRNIGNVDLDILAENQPTFWPLSELHEAVKGSFPALLQGWKPKFEPFQEEGTLADVAEFAGHFEAFIQVAALALVPSNCTICILF